MRKTIFYLIVFLFIFQGCATPSYMTSREGTIRAGMTKVEVLDVWGEPKQKSFLDEPDRLGRYELWRYPRMVWWAAYGVDLAFNKDGILVSIEPLVK